MFKKIAQRIIKSRISFVSLLVLGLVGLVSSSAMAIEAPAANSFGYTVYNFAVVQGLQGSFGFVGGIFTVLAGVGLGIQNKYLPAIATMLCGAILIGADDIVTSMGLLF
jgi:hypothetical protein